MENNVVKFNSNADRYENEYFHYWLLTGEDENANVVQAIPTYTKYITWKTIFNWIKEQNFKNLYNVTYLGCMTPQQCAEEDVTIKGALNELDKY